MRKLINIVLVGPMGAGKSSIGKAFAKEIGWNFYDSDQAIEECAGVDILWIYDLEGEEGFRSREKKIIAELVKSSEIVLATGGSTLSIVENREVIAANSFVIYLRTSLDDQLVRTGYSKKRPLSNEFEERRDILKKLRTEYDPLYEGLADIVCDTDSKSTRMVVADLIRIMKSKENISSLIPGFDLSNHDQ